MNVKKWSFADNVYKPYTVPENASMYEVDMGKKVSCANCGKTVKYGDTYTSLTIHSPYGMGYAVCKTCYYDELEDRQESLLTDEHKESV